MAFIELLHEANADQVSDFDNAQTLVLGGGDNDVGTSSTHADMTDNDPQCWSAWGSPWSCGSDSEWVGVARVNPAAAFNFATRLRQRRCQSVCVSLCLRVVSPACFEL